MPRDNPLANDGMFAKLKLILTPEEWRVRVEGRARLESMLVIDKFDPVANVHGHKVENVTWFAGMDYGYDHPTTWVLVGVDLDGNIWVDDEVVMRKSSVKDIASEIARRLGNRVLHCPTVIDNACYAKKDHRDTIAKEFENVGLKTTRSLGKSQDRERAQIEQLNEQFETSSLSVHTRCKELIRECQVWKYKRKADGSYLSNEQAEDKNNDCIDALRYILAKKPMHARWLNKKCSVISDSSSSRLKSNDPILDHLLAVNPDIGANTGYLHRMALQNQRNEESLLSQATNNQY